MSLSDTHSKAKVIKKRNYHKDLAASLRGKRRASPLLFWGRKTKRGVVRTELRLPPLILWRAPHTEKTGASLVLYQFSSVDQSCLTLCNPWPPCPSPTPGVYSNSCPSSRWRHPTISSSAVPFTSHLQAFPALGSSQMNQFFASGGQSIGISASVPVFPMNTQDWSPSGWTGWISLQSKGHSRVFSNTTVLKHLQCSAFFIVQLSYPYMTTGKTIALTVLLDGFDGPLLAK